MKVEKAAPAETSSLPKKLPAKSVLISKVQPNNWNPNEMTPEYYGKLKKGLARVLKGDSTRIPPIIVRRHPTEVGRYEIIDGFHRWKALTELKQKRINIFVVKADDKIARVLTNTLNYLRGQPNREKYGKGLVEIIELGMRTEDLVELLPETGDDIEQYLNESRISIKAFENLLAEDDEPTDESVTLKDSEDKWIDLKFKVTVDQAKVIEQEIARIGAAIKGKNARGRALEYMAANSSESPLPEDQR